MIEINLIIIFMIIAAAIAVFVKDLLSSVVAISAVGIGLTMGFLVLKAPDLAILQLVVEILSLIILVHATIRVDLPFSTSGRWLFNTISTLLFIASFLFIAHMIFKHLPQFGTVPPGAAYQLSENWYGKEDAGNMVTIVALKVRSLDTLGEVAALFTAVVGVLAIARKIGRTGGDEL